MQNSCKDLCPLPIVPSPVAPRIPPGDLIFTLRVPSGRQLSGISRFWTDFLLIKKRIEKQHPSETPKNRKSRPQERPKLDFRSILDVILAFIFLHISIPPENDYFETSIERNARFFIPKPPILASIFDQNFMQFPISLFERHFFDLLQNLVPKMRFWDPLWHPAGPKIAPQIRLVAPKAGKNKFLALTFARYERGPSAKTPPATFLVTIWVVWYSVLE